MHRYICWLKLLDFEAWQLQLPRTEHICTLLSVSTSLVYTAELDIPNYITAFYFGLTTLTTVGFGDFVPVSWEGRLFLSGSILAVRYLARLLVDD
jgi:voltage-gated potassium channel Kch